MEECIVLAWNQEIQKSGTVNRGQDGRQLDDRNDHA
jgi:hypothetical protein